LQKCWNFLLYLNSFKNGSKLCTHISNNSSPRWIYFPLVSQVDLFTFLLEIGKLSWFVHKSNVENYYNSKSNNRLQPSKHSHIGPISARCRNIDVGFRYQADIGPIYIIALLNIFSNYWVFNGLLMLIHLVFHIVTQVVTHITQVGKSMNQH